MGWPDHGSPADEDFSLVQKLLDKMVNSHILKKEKKLLVHCRSLINYINKIYIFLL